MATEILNVQRIDSVFNTNVASLSYTVPAGINRKLFVVAANKDSSTYTFLAGATFNSQSLTAVTGRANQNNPSNSINFYELNLGSGAEIASQVDIEWTEAVLQGHLIVFTVTELSQTAKEVSASSVSSGATSINVAVTTLSANALQIGVFSCGRGDSTLTATTQTELTKYSDATSPGLGTGISYGIKASPGSTTFTWTTSASSKLAMAVASFGAAPSVITAVAGSDQIAYALETVNLDGSNSFSPEGDVTYSWEFVSTPAGSTASITNPTTATPSFVPDLAGAYVIELTVDDGVDTATDQVSVTALVPRYKHTISDMPTDGESRTFGLHAYQRGVYAGGKSLFGFVNSLEAINFLMVDHQEKEWAVQDGPTVAFGDDYHIGVTLAASKNFATIGMAYEKSHNGKIGYREVGPDFQTVGSEVEIGTVGAYPHIFFDSSGNRYMVSRTTGETSLWGGIQFAKSSDGSTFTRSRIINFPTDGLYGYYGIDQNDIIHLMWCERYEQATASNLVFKGIYYVYSDDLGVTWKLADGTVVSTTGSDEISKTDAAPGAIRADTTVGSYRGSVYAAADGTPYVLWFLDRGTDEYWFQDCDPYVSYWDSVGEAWVDTLIGDGTAGYGADTRDFYFNGTSWILTVKGFDDKYYKFTASDPTGTWTRTEIGYAYSVTSSPINSDFTVVDPPVFFEKDTTLHKAEFYTLDEVYTEGVFLGLSPSVLSSVVASTTVTLTLSEDCTGDGTGLVIKVGGVAVDGTWSRTGLTDVIFTRSSGIFSEEDTITLDITDTDLTSSATSIAIQNATGIEIQAGGSTNIELNGGLTDMGAAISL